MEMPVSQVTEVGYIKPLSGAAFKLAKGQRFKVVSPLGQQVSDLCAVRQENHTDAFSANKTLDYAESIHISEGDKLYSCNDQPLIRIIEDKNGQNDCLLAPCSQGTFKHFYNSDDGRIGCLGNLRKVMGALDVPPAVITSTFNIFMNVQVDKTGKIEVKAPKGQAGDHVVFEALDDVVVGITACSAEMSNNYSFKPIEYVIYD